MLRCDRELSAGDPDAGNLLVQGDNLLALKALLPYYAGEVKCIYIDPPYNTGKEGWVYNDNVNSPEIRQWLGKVVGPEAEDLCRHDKWLCMMYPRLALLKGFLADDGIIFISIGKDEFGHLRLLCDDVFGPRNLVEMFIWHTEGHTENQERVTAVHEYVLAYERTPDRARIRDIVDPNVPEDSKIRRDFAENSITKNGQGNPPSVVVLPPGFPCAVKELLLHPFEQADALMKEAESVGYITRQMTAKYDVEYPVRLDEMVVKSHVVAKPCRVFSGWASARKLAAFIKNQCRLIDDEGTTLGYYLSSRGVIYYRREGRTSRWVQTVLQNMGTTERNRYELEAMGVHFPYPKPKELIAYLLSLATEGDDIVLDSFFGSGTTGHAAMLLNSNDGGKRRFIGVEMDSIIAQNCAARRLRALIEGFTSNSGSKRGRSIAGLRGGFRYCKLGNPLFDEAGSIAGEVRFPDLAAHVFFTETGSPIPARATGKTALLGVHQGKAVYLLFNGVLGDRRPAGGNVLTHDVAQGLPAHPSGKGPRVVYGEACRLGPKSLEHYGITFRQIPFELKVD